MRDSNPRMVGPEPTALPLGESPTVVYIITLAGDFVQILGEFDVLTTITAFSFYFHSEP